MKYIDINCLKSLGYCAHVVKDSILSRGYRFEIVENIKPGDEVLLNDCYYLVIEKEWEPTVSTETDFCKFHYSEAVRFTNSKGIEIEIFLTRINVDRENKDVYMNALLRRRRFKEFITDVINVEVYLFDKNGSCFWYTPQYKFRKYRKKPKINFDYILEDTEENRNKIIDKTLELLIIKDKISEIIGE